MARCTAKTKQGTRCRNTAVEGKKRCRMHSTSSTLPTRAERETAKRKAEFLETFSQCGIVTRTARSVGIDRRTVYLWLDSDPDFVVAFDDARDQAADALEDEARRRAVDGVEKPLVVGGHLVPLSAFTGDVADAERVATIREYSDTLLLKMLAANRPEKYGNKVELTGRNGGPVKHEVTDILAYRQSVAAELSAFLAGVDAARDDGGGDAGRERLGAEGPEDSGSEN